MCVMANKSYELLYFQNNQGKEEREDGITAHLSGMSVEFLGTKKNST